MTPISVFVDVPDALAASNSSGNYRRVAGMLDDNQTVVVATMVAGGRTADTEFSFKLGDAVALAETALTGDRRALTTPGLARILSATAAILFRVSLAAGAVQRLGDIHERDGGDHPDRDEAAGDEYPDD